MRRISKRAGMAVLFAASLCAPLPAMAEQLWLISAGDELAYLIDADSIVMVPGDIAKARIYQVYFQPQDVGVGFELRVISVDMDFDCFMRTYQSLESYGLDDGMNQVVTIPAQEAKPMAAGTNIEKAWNFACAQDADRATYAQLAAGNATLTGAVAIARQIGAEQGP